MGRVPQTAIDLIKSFEGCVLTSYQDIDGVWTVGWGHTGDDVSAGLVWSQEQADTALQQDAQRAYDSVCSLVSVDLNDNQASALTDFCYNLGAGNLQHSTLLIMLNDGSYDAVPEQLVRWCKDSSGNTVPGLLRRRLAEADLWNLA